MGSTTEQIKGATIGAIVTALISGIYLIFQEKIKSYWEENIDVSYEYTEIVVPQAVGETIPTLEQSEALEKAFSVIVSSNDIESKYNYEINTYLKAIKNLNIFYQDNPNFNKSIGNKSSLSAYNIEISNNTEKTVSSLQFPVQSGYTVGSNRKNIDIASESVTIKDILPNEKLNVYLFNIGNISYSFNKEITFTANNKKIDVENLSSSKYRPKIYTSFLEFMISVGTIIFIIYSIATILISSNSKLRRNLQSRSTIEQMKSDIVYHSEKNKVIPLTTDDMKH